MRSINIKNFKCFKDETINFRNLTVLAGGNGAGKSTVIQSFLLITQNINKSNFDNPSKIMYLNDYYCNLGSANSLLHHNSDEEYIELTFFDDYNHIKFNLTKDLYDSNILDSHISGYKTPLDFVKYFDFIGADRLGPKSFHQIDANFSRISVGRQGEYTALVLNNNKLKNLVDNEGRLLSKVNFWLSEIFGNVQVNTKFDDEAGIAVLKIKNHIRGEYQSSLNMPYGVSYLLPIIVSCMVRQVEKSELYENYDGTGEENEMVIIENPEAHLHPSAQSKLGYFLAKMSMKMQIIVETHSEHIINGIRLATLEDEINHEKIIINFFESSQDGLEPNITEIEIDEFNDLTDWPKGFFDQQAMDIGKIYQERTKRNVKN